MIGLLAALLVLGVGGLGALSEAEGVGTIVGGGLAAIFFAALSLVAGVLALWRPGLKRISRPCCGAGRTHCYLALLDSFALAPSFGRACRTGRLAEELITVRVSLVRQREEEMCRERLPKGRFRGFPRYPLFVTGSRRGKPSAQTDPVASSDELEGHAAKPENSHSASLDRLPKTET